MADQVDVIEPIEKFTAALKDTSGVGQVFNVGLEGWTQSEPGCQYGLIWIQWCAGHLNDEQLIQFFARCKKALVPETGVIVLKENMSTSEGDIFDPVDSSVTRYEFRTAFPALFQNIAAYS